jgi:UDP-galactopyranose mutase
VSLLKALNPLLQKITDELYQQMTTKKFINYDTASILFERYKKQNNKKIFVEMAVQIGLSKSKVRNLGDKVVPSIYSQLYEKCFQIYAIKLKLIFKKTSK